MRFLLRQVLKTLLHHIFLPAAYRFFCVFSKVDPRLVLFADAHANTVPVSMERLRQLILARGFQVEDHFLDFGKASLAESVRAMLRFLRSYAKAGTVFLCSYYLSASSVKKRKGTMLVQLWHASGVLKKFGFDTREDIPASFHGNPAAGYDLVTVSAPVCVPYYTQALRLPEGVCKPLGVARTDVFFEEGYKERCRRQFFARYPACEGKKIALWAPTFRGNAAQSTTEGSGMMREFSPGEDWVLVTKLHPNAVGTEGLFQPEIPTEELFAVADVLITDYSTVLFEFALFDKPMVLCLPDGDAYQRGRGLYIPVEEIPAPVVRELSELEEAVRQMDKWYDPEKNRAFLEKYMTACDGHAAQRILQAVWKER